MRLLDILKERARDEHAEALEALREEREKDRVACILARHPEIGAIVRQGVQKFYIVKGFDIIEADDPADLVGELPC